MSRENPYKAEALAAAMKAFEASAGLEPGNGDAVTAYHLAAALLDSYPEDVNQARDDISDEQATSPSAR